MKLIISSAEDLAYQGMKDYTSYISKSRVLPYIDGLKPVFRRILYSLLRLNATDKFIKTSTVLGEAVKFHCHGSGSVAGAIQTLVCSPNSLITGKGNWGNGIYSPEMAAERYTEVKLSPIFLSLLDSHYKLGEFVPSYDEADIEPRNFQCHLPLAELIGISGIGVALVTNCPSLHVSSVIDKTLSILDSRPFSTSYAYGSFQLDNTIYPEFSFFTKDDKTWLSITSIPNSRYLDPINESPLIRELAASGQLIIDDQSHAAKGIVKYNVYGPTSIYKLIISKLSFKPLSNFSFYDGKIKNSDYYRLWVAHKLSFIKRKLTYLQLQKFNLSIVHSSLSTLHQSLLNQPISKEGFLSLVDSIGNQSYDSYFSIIQPFLDDTTREFILSRDDFLSKLKSTPISSLKHYPDDDSLPNWSPVSHDDCIQSLTQSINQLDKSIFSPPSKQIKSLPTYPPEVKITRYVALRGNQVEIRFKKIPRVTNWSTDGNILIVYEDGSTDSLSPNQFGIIESQSSKKIVGFTFPSTVTIFITDTHISAYSRISKVTEIIKSAFPCKKISINGKQYKVNGGRNWPIGQWSIVEP